MWGPFPQKAHSQSQPVYQSLYWPIYQPHYRPHVKPCDQPLSSCVCEVFLLLFFGLFFYSPNVLFLIFPLARLQIDLRLKFTGPITGPTTGPSTGPSKIPAPPSALPLTGHEGPPTGCVCQTIQGMFGASRCFVYIGALQLSLQQALCANRAIPTLDSLCEDSPIGGKLSSLYSYFCL